MNVTIDGVRQVDAARQRLEKSGMALRSGGGFRVVHLSDSGPVVGAVIEIREEHAIFMPDHAPQERRNAYLSRLAPAWIFRCENMGSIMGWLDTPATSTIEFFEKRKASVKNDIASLQRRGLIDLVDGRYVKSALYLFVEPVL